QHRDKRGVLWEMKYDNTGRKLSDQVHEGAAVINVLSVAYDDAANSETRTDADGHATVHHYDGLRRVDGITNADGKTRSFVYDGEDLREEGDFFDLPNRRTKYVYDGADRVTQITDRKGQVTTFA